MYKKITNEPLIIFFIVASLLFTMEYYFNESEKTLLHITPQTQEAILAQETALKGDALSEAEAQKAIDTYIEQKILLDEVVRLGLDKDRSIERKLLRKIRAIYTASIGEPSEQQLRDYYDANKNKYLHPTLWDIEYYIYDDKDEIPEDFAEYILDTNNAKALTGLSKISETEIMIRVGKQVSRGLKSLKKHTWHGPIRTLRGRAFVNVSAHYEGEQKDFTEVKRYVRDAWREAEQDKIMAQKLSQLKQNYHILVDDLEGVPSV